MSIPFKLTSPLRRRLTLAAEFNLLTIGLILITSIGITAFVIRQEIRNNYSELVNRGVSMAVMMSQNSEYSLYTEDKKSLQQLADGIASDENISYVSIMNAQDRVLVSKTKDPSLAVPASLAGRSSDPARKISTGIFLDEKTGDKYLDILAEVVSGSSSGSGDLLGLGAGPESTPANSGPKTIGYVRLGLTQAGLRKRIREFLFSMILVTALIVLGGVGLTVLMTKRITAPINRLVRIARDISEGKLDHVIKHEGSIEIVELAQAIENMNTNLRDMIGQLSGLASNVTMVTARITDSPASIMRVVDAQKDAIENAVKSIAEVNASITAISRSSESLRSSAGEASSAAVRLTGSTTKVAEQADVFDEMAHKAGSSVEQMVASISEISANLEALAASSEETSSALTQVDSTIKEIQRNAGESVKFAEKVSSDAENKGIASAGAAIRGIENARDAVGKLAASINSLGKRSQEIGAIVTVIDDVADHTSLLALNASILAAQAGQHGNAFAVVAAEIKGLAERTSDSTREISRLISSVQAEVKSSMKMAEEGTQVVQEGMDLVTNVNAALQGIRESAMASTDMSRAIQRATVEEAKVIHTVTDTIREQAQQIAQITKSTSEQTQGSRLITVAVEKVKDASHQVTTVAAEQLESSKRISFVSENVASQASQITEAIGSQKRKSDELVGFTDKIQETTANLIASADEMNRTILALSNDAQRLTGELQKFKT